uniref:Ion_trans domain-containing protein n=1 Tax=Macrostomum lignano TaxID=282301 RepID=A0A1I8FJ21_9PLAT
TVNPHLQQGLPATTLGGSGRLCAVLCQLLPGCRVMQAAEVRSGNTRTCNSKDSKEFNLRATFAPENYLESMPFFYFMLVLGRLRRHLPGRPSSVRQGYSTGDPKKRIARAFGYIGLFTLLLNTVILGGRMIKAGLRQLSRELRVQISANCTQYSF